MKRTKELQKAKNIRKNNIPKRYRGFALTKERLLELRQRYLFLQGITRRKRDRFMKAREEFNAGVTKRQRALKAARRGQLRAMGIID